MLSKTGKKTWMGLADTKMGIKINDLCGLDQRIKTKKMQFIFIFLSVFTYNFQKNHPNHSNMQIIIYFISFIKTIQIIQIIR